ncbi:trigger factor [Neoaquamicrobium sediminum]|uniref:trigger factor n=1 Tax=Neoaquamicrobium sediminum TaxID=1849104 RepID=UPI001565B1D5|nr:trigger factor [Mesorhizobium sediminum]MBX9461763.1 trigger factor [Aquamicrobium sp.]NRC55281.1 trigger factor [Mesorhizobium sediminum]
MQVTETLNNGLKRQIKVTVPAKDMEARLMERLSSAKDKVRINGFRPGKVPMQHLRKMYGKSFMAEVVNEILSDSSRSILDERGEKPAMQPEVTMTEDEKEAEKILAGNADFEFSLDYEVLPPIEEKDLSSLKISRLVYDVPEEEVTEQVERVADSARSYEPKKGKAANGDRVTFDYLGKIDGEAFEGGAAEDSDLVLGSNQFIPGFEEQLVGVKEGDETTITVTFPEQYPAAHLAGKEAKFDIKVKAIAAPGKLEINDDVAKQLGLESADKLREIVRGQIESQFGAVTRQKAKRQLLDALDEAYKFEAPSKLVEAEFNNIWAQVNADLAQAGRTFEDEETTETEARAEYQRLAERRVRLGLVLADIGEKASVQVSDDELQRALFEQIRRVPQSQQQQVYDFYRENPQALANIRAPLFEEKVVDHLLGVVSVDDKKVSKEELLADDEEETAKSEKKPAKKASKAKAADAGDDAGETEKKKAAPKKKAAAKDKDAE